MTRFCILLVLLTATVFQQGASQTPVPARPLGMIANSYMYWYRERQEVRTYKSLAPPRALPLKYGLPSGL